MNRVNPKDINKLQLEGLVKAGAFDNLNANRQSLFNSIPNLILKSKNNFENKIANQIDLFSTEEVKDEDIILRTNDWKFEERLSKEFEAVGFFISDHPLNQFKEIFEDYKIIDFNKFKSENDAKEKNIAATLLKIQERKTLKGNSYAIIKFTDLSSVFELFIFSDMLELNRDSLIEGNSLILTLSKNVSDDENRFKRINVKKIASLKDLFNKEILKVEFCVNDAKKINEILNLVKKEGKTEVKIKIKDQNKNLVFILKNKRLVDRKSINMLKNQDILTTFY
jgi:DNA polymerase-3 subunit alpha